MWIENFRQFLNRSLQRIGDWLCGIEFLPARLVRRGPVSPEENWPDQSVFGTGKTPFITGSLTGDWPVDLSYSFRSLHCHMRVRILEPTRGMKFIYRALQGQDEA